MYKVGDVFVYGSNGACQITDIKEEKFARETKVYYILSPFLIQEKLFLYPLTMKLLQTK